MSGLEEISRLVQEGRFTPRQLMMMLGAWTGTAGFLGWAGLEASLKDGRELRGKIRICLRSAIPRLKATGNSRGDCFSSHGPICPPQSPFQKLAQDQLDKLAAK